MSDLRFLLVSGMSGSGKTIALQALEDLGYYCIDNLPAELIPSLANNLQNRVAVSLDDAINRCAVSVDVRNRQFLTDLPEHLKSLVSLQIPYSVLFLDAEQAVLVSRYSETRRKHPLTNSNTSLLEAIDLERGLLAPLAELADRQLDTTQTTPHELRAVVRDFAGGISSAPLSLLFESFGFKYGTPLDADFVFDVRCLPNPHWNPELRQLTGRDRAVIKFLESENAVAEMLESIAGFLRKWLPDFERENRSYITIAIGCTGGQHRSVYLCQQMGAIFENRDGISVQVRHRELQAI
jgi:RNase adapter protein RapZ